LLIGVFIILKLLSKLFSSSDSQRVPPPAQNTRVETVSV
jgi:hypothetical protein